MLPLPKPYEKSQKLKDLEETIRLRNEHTLKWMKEHQVKFAAQGLLWNRFERDEYESIPVYRADVDTDPVLAGLLPPEKLEALTPKEREDYEEGLRNKALHARNRAQKTQDKFINIPTMSGRETDESIASTVAEMLTHHEVLLAPLPSSLDLLLGGAHDHLWNQPQFNLPNLSSYSSDSGLGVLLPGQFPCRSSSE